MKELGTFLGRGIRNIPRGLNNGSREKSKRNLSNLLRQLAIHKILPPTGQNKQPR